MNNIFKIYDVSDVTPKLGCSRKQQRKRRHFPFIHDIKALHVATNLSKEQSGRASQLWAREGVAAGGRQHLNRNRSSIGKGANWQRKETNERRLSLYLQNMLQNTIFTIKRQQSLLRSKPKQSLKVIIPIMIYNIPWCQLLLNSIVIHNRCVLLLIVILNIQKKTVFEYHERVQSYMFTPSLNFRKWHHSLRHHSERAWKTFKLVRVSQCVENHHISHKVRK